MTISSEVPSLVICVGHALSGNMPFEFRVSFPPTLVPHNPLLMEYAAFSKFISTPLAFKYSISASLLNCKSRIGVKISTPGIMILKIISNRTWSLPAPVLPCATNLAPTFFTCSAMCKA